MFQYLLPTSYVLFFAGGAVAFFAVLPAATTFFLSFGEGDIRPLISISDYVDSVEGQRQRRLREFRLG